MKKIVIKIGSSSLIDEEGKLNTLRLDSLIKELSMLALNDIQSIIVTSGAVAVGAYKLKVKPRDIKMKQACAAVGQGILMHGYETACDKYNLKCAQILLNHDDFEDKHRMLTLKDTLTTLLDNKVIPIINENDALAVEEIKVGDNDTLSAMVSPIAEANLLVLMSDIDGLYTDNPKINKDAKLIKVVEELDDEILNMAKGTSTNVGTGGMQTKLKAAKIATSSGVDMIIMNSDKLSLLHNVFTSDYSGTLFKANENKLKAFDQWVLFNTRAKGNIIIDKGASVAVLNRKSLLAKGITSVIGKFHKQEIVNIICDDMIIAKGITNYSSREIEAIKGKASIEMNSILGYVGKEEVVHANNITLIKGEQNE